MTDLWIPDSVDFSEEELAERAQRRDHYYQLAQEVRDVYAGSYGLTIDEVCERIEGSGHAEIAFILNEFVVHPDQTVEHVGPGKGGGWIPLEYQAKLTEAEPPTDIGNRWPDGSLREEPFDITNPEHRAEFGLPDPEPEPATE